MADVMTGLETTNVDAARAHLAEAIAHLSTLTGALPDDLRVLLGPDGTPPMFTATPRKTSRTAPTCSRWRSA
jgi:hypothetical protein